MRFRAKHVAFDNTECQRGDALGRLQSFRIRSKLRGEFSSCNFSQGDVCKSHLKVHLDHGAASGGKLAQTLAYHVNELLLICNDLRGLFDVVGVHGKCEKWLQR